MLSGRPSWDWEEAGGEDSPPNVACNGMLCQALPQPSFSMFISDERTRALGKSGAARCVASPAVLILEMVEPNRPIDEQVGNGSKTVERRHTDL